MGTLASVLEDAGLATVALSIIRGQVETTRPPRALHCEFPLGRPLGRPGDPALQRRVIDAAFALLDQTDAADPEAEIVLRRRASGYLARSMDADPLNFQTYLGLNDVRRGQVRYPTDNDLSTLHVAISLAPQSFDSRMRLAEAFIARGMNAEAIQILQPVANSPHSSGFKRRARQLIATASGEAVVVGEPEPEDEGAETAAPSS